MRAAFDRHAAIGVRGVDLECGGLDARLLGIRGVHHLGLVSIALGPAQVHAQQHLGEVRGIDTACAGSNGHDGGTGIVFAVHQRLDLHLVEILLDAFNLGLCLVERVGVVLLLAELDERGHIVETARGARQMLQLGLACAQLAHHLLRGLGVIPQSRSGGLLLKLGLLGLQTIGVQREGDGLVLGAGVGNRLRIIEFCHNLSLARPLQTPLRWNLFTLLN